MLPDENQLIGDEPTFSEDDNPAEPASTMDEHALEEARRAMTRRLGPDERAAAAQIADALGEQEYGPRRLIESVIRISGVPFAWRLLRETVRIQLDGGMMVQNEDRQRTIGGVFFYLARGRMSREARYLAFPSRAKKAKERKKKQQQRPCSRGRPQANSRPVVVVPALPWEERLAILEPLLEEQGELSTVKITLIGRPGRIEKRKDLIVTTMTHVVKTTSWPKGLPLPPATPTLYTVYIGSKQWNKVDEAIGNPDDALIIEGTCAYDAEVGGIAVFATNVTTKALEVDKREKQRQTAPPEEGDGQAQAAAPPAAAKLATAKPAAPRPAARATAAPATPAPVLASNVPIPANAPPAAAQKLRELHAAAELYRQKIATIESKPDNQQFGLDMTHKLLRTVEEQIKALEQKYA